jgi:glycolate oxidase iron-sulfur subunit
MRNSFTAEQSADPQLGPAVKAVRACVHCGICTATCPTYVLLGDERDGPRGRIVQMQKMLEEGGAPSPETVHHIDRCLSCLNCKTACPSSVDYRRLVDEARSHIERHYRRPLGERLLRWMIARVMTRPRLVALGLMLAPLGLLLPGRLGAMARIGTAARPKGRDTYPDVSNPVRRVALLTGCVQGAAAPQIDAAAARVLARRGIALVPLDGAACCGALPHHLGRDDDSRALARRVIASYEAGGFEGLLITATGCSSQLKDLAHQFAGDPVWQPRARAVAAAALDFAELVTPLAVKPPAPLRAAYHPPCSLQNSLKLPGRGEALLEAAGVTLLPFGETHICCGSAGSYAILQPELSQALKARKLGHIQAAGPDVIVSGNIGCLMQLDGTIPARHLAEILDWAEGGPTPMPLVEMPATLR